MKKIFIYAYNLELGGVERSLIGLLEAIDPKEYQVDLFLAKQEGELLRDVPGYVNLIPVDKRYQAFGIPITDAIKEGYFFEAYQRMKAKLQNRLLQKMRRDKSIAIESFLYHKEIIAKMKPQSEHYDLAISFAMPYFYVLEKVDAKTKIGFVHTDYSKINIDFPFLRDMFQRIDYICPVSEAVGECLRKRIPVDQGKIKVIENILPVESVKRLSLEPQNEIVEDGAVHLLSIGRFGEAKNFDSIPEICSLVKENGQNIKWFLIGFGSAEHLIRDRIKEYEVENNVIILGKKSNPYPYIRACDIYIQPSRYEGKAVTVREAQMLGKPVVITCFPTARSQVKDGIDGMIVPIENKKCAKGISETIMNKALQTALSDYCNAHDYSNMNSIEVLYSLIQ